MTSFDLARFGGEPERLRCNAEQTRRLVQIKPWLVPIWRRPKDRDLMMRPQRGDPLPCPAIAVAGHQAGTGPGSELRRPLGITIIGGLILSQALTLYTTPVIYLLLDRLHRRLWGGRGGATAEGRAPRRRRLFGFRGPTALSENLIPVAEVTESPKLAE